MQGKGWVVLAVVAIMFMSGCLGGETAGTKGAIEKRKGGIAFQGVDPNTVFWITNSLGQYLPNLPDELQAELGQPIGSALSYTGGTGAEPNIGVTKEGNVFVTAFTKTYRSTDHGVTWQVAYDHAKQGVQCCGNPIAGQNLPNNPAPRLNGTSDPMLWVDPVTSRVFTDHMLGLYCSDMAYSDDEGKTWTQRPLACGIPGNDHQKWSSSKRTSAGPPMVPGADYPSAVYYCYNKAAVAFAIGQTWCAVSYDGGMVFSHDQPVVGHMPDHPCGGINGHPAAAPDGTVYVPLTYGCGRPVVAVSEDNGLTWTVRQGPGGVGGTEIDPDITVTPDGTAYMFYRGSGFQMFLVRSKDKFQTWDGPWKVNPPQITAAAYAGITSGANGRIAMAYVGTEHNITNPDTNPQGSPSYAPNETKWNAYITYSLNADSVDPVFATTQANPPEDPLQRGCVWIGGGGNPCRNMLDFIDMASDADGRIFAAFTDGCTKSHRNGACAYNETALPDTSRSRDNAVAIAIDAPSLTHPGERVTSVVPPAHWDVIAAQQQ